MVEIGTHSSCPLVYQALVTRFQSISTRNLSTALKILTADKTMVAMSDYNDYHKTVKRHILTAMLGPNAQKKHRIQRDIMMENLSNRLHAFVKTSTEQEEVDVREIFQSELFGLAMRQTMGKDVESLYVEDLKITMKRREIFQVLVLDPMMGAIDVDWRDFFPYLRWVPNTKFENPIREMHVRREAVMKALIKEQKKRIASGEKLNSYIDYMLSEAQTLTDHQLLMSVWEPIIESSDTTMVTTEWAIYELAKNPHIQVCAVLSTSDLTNFNKKMQFDSWLSRFFNNIGHFFMSLADNMSCNNIYSFDFCLIMYATQDRLYRDIQNVCGSDKITEEHLSQLPYIAAIFHETLRRHSPVPIIPLRYVHEDTVLGGYHVPAGTEVAVNIYGCNMEKNVWENPEVWDPDRFMKEKEPIDFQRTMAFGGGKRVCAGSLQAMLISCVGIGRMVQEFKWELKDNTKEDVNTIGLTTQMLRPLKAIIKPRK
ncbi:putative ent-kaurene monooxygenase [Helianthus annuus]|nr:putative ent-kaurene monooxygenase [Helianthus annuus]